MTSLLEPVGQKKFLKKLLAWYKKNGRHDMPWRTSKNPYAVFVSEFMLQQTTVATVRPYFDRFMKKFPTVKSLADADLNDVLALWSGLGYYARARNLWSAMRAILADFRGKIPSDLKILATLPGVGPYTAGAVASFGFNRPAAVLDGNVARLFMRLLAIEDDPKLKAVQVILKKLGLDLTDGNRSKKGGPRDINLALMDVGATVCVAQNPKCGECPVAEFCLAKYHNRQNDIPLRGEKPDRPTIRRLFGIVEWDGKRLMGQRPKEGLFGGLWEFLGVDAPSGVDPIEQLEKGIQREIGFKIRVKEALPAFEHQLSHRIFVVRPFICEPLTTGPDLIPEKGKIYERFRWVSIANLSRLGLSSITSRILAALQSEKF